MSPLHVSRPVDFTLVVDSHVVSLRGPGTDIGARHAGIGPGLLNAVEESRRARSQIDIDRLLQSADSSREFDMGSLYSHVSTRRAGELMAKSFLCDSVGSKMREIFDTLEEQDLTVRIGIEFTPEAARLGWTQLPWEALPDPISGQPLALNPRAVLYRSVPSVPARIIKNQLKIVVAISSPDNSDGEQLDYEAELRSVLEAVRGARASSATIEIIPFATTSAIHAALNRGDVQVLHISAHGGPGVLYLEDEQGNSRAVAANKFILEAIPKEKMPPIIALAACYTNTPAPVDTNLTGSQVPELWAGSSFAQQLLMSGASVVIGTETSITDTYATRVLSQVYRNLAQGNTLDVVYAVSLARQAVEHDLTSSPATSRDRALAKLDEWATVTVLSSEPEPLIGSLAPSGQQREGNISPNKPISSNGTVTGEFVGRRNLLRSLRGEILAGHRSGILLTGIGGIGKSALAMEVTRLCVQSDERIIPIWLSGTIRPETLINEVGAALSEVIERQVSSKEFVRRLESSRRVELPWPERFAHLQYVLDSFPTLLIMDNFEDNLEYREAVDYDTPSWIIKDKNLSDILVAWLTSAAKSRILLTSRYPPELPSEINEKMIFNRVGPLSLGEVMKLAWSMPQLERLDNQKITQVWRVVGGHPRTLQYLDAILARDPDRLHSIGRRLEAEAVRVVLKSGGDPEGWMRTTESLDAALADAVTFTADDILLDQIIADVAPIENAIKILVGTSVYREVVDLQAVMFQLGDGNSIRRISDWVQARRRVMAAVEESNIQLPVPTGKSAFDQIKLLNTTNEDLTTFRAGIDSPRQIDVRIRRAIDSLSKSSLLNVTVDEADTDLESSDEKIFIHRSTAAVIARKSRQDGRVDSLRLAHHAAAEYWLWLALKRGRAISGKASTAFEFRECRFHLLEAGENNLAVELTLWIDMDLYMLGAWPEARDLLLTTLRTVPIDDKLRPELLLQLGMSCQNLGDFEDAKKFLEAAIRQAIDQGDDKNLAWSHHHLGIVNQDLNDYDSAEYHATEGIRIFESLGLQIWRAWGQHLLGVISFRKSEYEKARDQFNDALVAFDRLGFTNGKAWTLHELSMLSREFGAYSDAHNFSIEAIEIADQENLVEVLGQCFESLGRTALSTGDLEQAFVHFHKALDIAESIGDKPGIASICNALGDLSYHQNYFSEAERLFRRSLDISTGVDSPYDIAVARGQIARIAHAKGNLDEAISGYLECLRIFETLGSKFDAAIAHYNIASVARGRGDFISYRDHVDSAVTFFQEIGNREYLTKILESSGSYAFDSGNFADAERYYLEILQMSSDSETEPPELAGVYFELGSLARERNSSEEAQFRYTRAAELSERAADGINLGRSWLSLGILARERNAYDEAERLFSRALELYQSMTYGPGIIYAQKELGKICAATGQYRKAVYWHILALAGDIMANYTLESEADLAVLGDLLQTMGHGQFRSAAAQVLDDNSLESLMQQLSG